MKDEFALWSWLIPEMNLGHLPRVRHCAKESSSQVGVELIGSVGWRAEARGYKKCRYCKVW